MDNFYFTFPLLWILNNFLLLLTNELPVASGTVEQPQEISPLLQSWHFPSLPFPRTAGCFCIMMVVGASVVCGLSSWDSQCATD